MAANRPTPRTHVLCFDGTGDKFSTKNSNVVKIFSLLKKNSYEQTNFYQPGIGTYFEPGAVSPMWEGAAKLLDEAFAWYLDTHVMEGYKFLMDNYRIGDKICLYGFSRGAYTARAVAGFLDKIGLLQRDNLSQVPLAYEMYKRTDSQNIRLCADFKQTYCRSVVIDFLGVWDTVASVGFVWSRDLPFTSSNSGVKVFRHALSLDEHRTKFRPNHYHRTPPGSTVNHYPGPPSDVLEVWFAGCHSDVGGGSVVNEVQYSLANITLRWMVHETIKSGFSHLFDVSALERANISYGPTLTPPEMEIDGTDAVQRMHDQLKKNILWWMLEIIPFRFSWQDENDVWHSSSVPNFGRGRDVLEPHPKIHVSVKKRMQSKKLRYKPRAEWKPDSEVYIL